jgi:hypothetical protein
MKTKKLYSGKIPFSPTKKRQLDYDYKQEWHHEGDDVVWLPLEWLENKPFSARIKFNGYGRGRSSAVFFATLLEATCDDANYQERLIGCEVSIFMSDMSEIIQVAEIENGYTWWLNFAFCKKGSNYGLCLIGDEERL